MSLFLLTLVTRSETEETKDIIHYFYFILIYNVSISANIPRKIFDSSVLPFTTVLMFIKEITQNDHSIAIFNECRLGNEHYNIVLRIGLDFKSQA